jgi:DNA modification methylase
MQAGTLGPFPLGAVTQGDCRKLLLDLPDESVDVVVTSPPYWGQRTSDGNGVEADPRS